MTSGTVVRAALKELAGVIAATEMLIFKCYRICLALSKGTKSHIAFQKISGGDITGSLFAVPETNKFHWPSKRPTNFIHP